MAVAGATDASRTAGPFRCWIIGARILRGSTC